MSEPRRVLVPTDDSPSALKAVEHVIELARAGLSIEVHLLNVQLPVRGTAASLIAKSELNDYHREEGTKALAAAKAKLEAAGLKVEPHIGVGEPGETILAFAKRLQCGQIIMGTRGLGAAAGLVLGSVATYVVSHGGLPVTLLHA